MPITVGLCRFGYGGINMKYLFCLFLLLAVAACSGNQGGVTLAAFSDGKVSVIRSAYNQPALKVLNADSGIDADLKLFEAQGYIQAYDRFLQMDLIRRQGGGTLAEVFGDSSLDKDREVHGTGLPSAARKSLDRIQLEHPEVYQSLVAYSRGVNKFLEKLEENRPNWARIYRQYTKDAHYVPRQWEPLDSVIISEAVSFHLSSAVMPKATFGMIALGVASEFAHLPDVDDLTKFTEIWDLRPLENQFIVGNYRPKTSEAGSIQATMPHGRINKWASDYHPETMIKCRDLGFPFPPCKQRDLIGSNNWVVSKTFAGGEASFLANDPHLAITFPTVFYEIALDSTAAGGSYHVRGLSLAGVPGVLIGHNQAIGWGMTNLGADVDDIYIEEFNANRSATKFKGEWVKILEETQTIKVRQVDGSLRDEPFKYRVVPHHGPVLSEYHGALKESFGFVELLAQKKLGLSYRWTGHQGSSELIAILGINRATNYESFRSALKLFEVGAQNIVYADKEGNIGYFAHGKFPIRKYVSKTLPPYVPVPGTGEYEWSGFREEAQVPQEYNPKTGRIVTANNDPFGQSHDPFLSQFDDYFGAGFSTGSRATRITELLDQKKGNINLKDIQSMQIDHLDMTARRFIALLREHGSAIELASDGASLLREKLLNWDLQSKRNQEQPLLFDIWLNSVTGDFMQTVLADLPDQLTKPFRLSTLTIKSAYHRLADSLQQGDMKVGTEALKRTLEAAAEVVEKDGLWGSHWGSRNRLIFKNPLEGIVPTFAVLPIERDGAWDTVDVAGDGVGPNFRLSMSIKPGQPIEAYNVLPGGNYSIFEMNDMYRELFMWRDGGVRPLVAFQD